MGQIGIKLQNPLSIRENVLLAQYAEARGLDMVWASEYRRDAVVLMSMLAAGTERVAVGSSIVPIYTRSAVVLAISAAAANELGPGRVELGIGTSTKPIVERWHGLERRAPMQALEEYVVALRAILAGEKVRFEGEVVRVDGFQLEHPSLAAPALPIWTAALGDAALELAGRIADGALLNAAPVGHVPSIRAHVEAGAAAAGRPAGAVRIAGDVRVGVAAGAAAKRLREAQRKAMASYGRVGPYNRFYAHAGYPEQAAVMREAFAARDVARATAAMDDEMLDAIVAIGEADAVQAQLARFLEAGMDQVIVYPLWDEGESPGDAIRRIVDVVAEVRSAVR